LLGEGDRLLPAILERLEKAMHDTVGREVVERFADGLPAWENAPGYINMPVILWLRHLVLAYDMREYARMRYNLLGNGGHWFPGLNAAAAEHLDLRKAVVNSPFKEQIPSWLKETHELLFAKPEKRLSQS
jgi:predicted aldo/keto reductase-like oxidoreductase